jgi:hypothetical protein
LKNFSIDLLKFYIEIERPQYVRETNDQVLAEIRSAWAELTDWLSKHFQRACGSCEYGFRLATAQKAFNGTTSILIDCMVPRQFLTMLA